MNYKFPGQKMAIELLYCPTGSKYAVVDIGETGYRPLTGRNECTIHEIDSMLLNAGHISRLPTEEEREAAYIGSVFGWDVPGSNPEYMKKLNEKNKQTEDH